jgi:hypothetical protein
MKAKLLTLAAAAAVIAGIAGATPAAAATPGAPIAKTIEFKTTGPAHGVVQVRYYRRHVSYRVCRRWRYLGYRRGIRRYRYLYRRYCRGGHHVSYRRCRRWFYLGFRRHIPRYRHLYRRYCRWYR